MRTFLQWAEEGKLDLPLLTEKTARSGIAYWMYPDLYVRSHYPDGWFMPRSADALFKMGKHHPPHAQHVNLNQIPKGM
jgi:hypothetical protein